MNGHSEYRRFVAEQERDASLRAAVAKLGADDDAIVEFAAVRGFRFTKADVEHQAADGELSDQQLDQVAGGLAQHSETGGSHDRSGGVRMLPLKSLKALVN